MLFTAPAGSIRALDGTIAVPQSISQLQNPYSAFEIGDLICCS
jgi:hypothetical protein